MIKAKNGSYTIINLDMIGLDYGRQSSQSKSKGKRKKIVNYVRVHAILSFYFGTSLFISYLLIFSFFPTREYRIVRNWKGKKVNQKFLR